MNITIKVNVSYYLCFSIVHIALLNKEVEALHMIIDMLKNVGLEDVADFQNKSLQTPLHLAVEDEMTDVITMLLGINASVNIPDKDGDTPVHIAVRKGSVKTLTSLFGSNVSFTAAARNVTF